MWQALAVEYASVGLRFNCVSPGLCDTQIWADIQTAAERAGETVAQCHAKWWDNIPAARICEPSEVGSLCSFLASDRAAYITGSNVVIDGGMTSQLVAFQSASSEEPSSSARSGKGKKRAR